MNKYTIEIIDGCEVMVFYDGATHWIKDGTHHRLDGPAIEDCGHKEWGQFGKRHRLDGPAIERIDGSKEWWINGERIDCDSQEEFERLIKMKAFW